MNKKTWQELQKRKTTQKFTTRTKKNEQLHAYKKNPQVCARIRVFLRDEPKSSRNLNTSDISLQLRFSFQENGYALLFPPMNLRQRESKL